MDGDLYDEFGNYIGPELSGSEPVSSTGCMAPSCGLAADAGCMHTAPLCMRGPPMQPGAGPQRMRIRAAGRPWSCTLGLHMLKPRWLLNAREWQVTD